MKTDKEGWKCLECGTFNPDFHVLTCSLQTPEQKIARLEGIVTTLESMQNNWKESARQARQEGALWYGKYRIVSQENNTLRRKLFQRREKNY